MIDLLQSLVDGLLFGTTYSLIGIGFTLVFGVMHKINMAYAAASIAGAYAGLVLLQYAGLPPTAVLLLACLAGAAFGIVIYALCFRFIPLSTPLATLMSTVGMLLLIDEIVVHLTAGMPVNYPTVMSGTIDIGDFMLRGDLMFVFLVAVLAMAVLMYIDRKSTRLNSSHTMTSRMPSSA